MTPPPDKQPGAADVTTADLAHCTRVLEALVESRAHLAALSMEERNRLLAAAGRLSRPHRNEQRALSRALSKKGKKEQRQADEALLERASIRKKRAHPVFITPKANALAAEAAGEAPEVDPTLVGQQLKKARVCYVCKQLFSEVHFFYDQMCQPCGDFNHMKRGQTADLRGRVALITGARVKIGFQAAIMLLRAGARVIVTTRFPHDAAIRYAGEADHADWADRLQIYGLDLRHTPSVEAFARHVTAGTERLDFILHNACQTVRRPPGFYRHLMEVERTALHALPERARGLLAAHAALGALVQAPDPRGATLGPSDPSAFVGLHQAASLSQVPVAEEDHDPGLQLFPNRQLDADLQQVDLRSVNSWRLALHEVSTVELLEVQLVNAIAPFVLNARLKPLMLRHRTGDKHIVNVSAVEGQFHRRYKTDKHPHTNMAKAALNMMTRTSADDYVKDGIHMNSVDTGWVTDEDPAHIARRKAIEHGFSPPLDIVDGAARIVDPIFSGMSSGEHVWGLFLKDYKPVPW
ncbi:MAG: SDR family oxidoreductase [Myxococcales bacterium]|nr:SDR family oxidoreductase [Myxococcales bacterium]